MARPHKFTSETVDALIEAVRTGLPFHLAAEAAGISGSLFFQWQAGKFPRGADPGLKTEFQERLTRAKGESALSSMKLIKSAALEDWRAAAWLLERRFPQEFGKAALEITGSDGGPVQFEVSSLQRVILKALESHPDARIDVAEALQEAKRGKRRS